MKTIEKVALKILQNIITHHKPQDKLNIGYEYMYMCLLFLKMQFMKNKIQ